MYLMKNNKYSITGVIDCRRVAENSEAMTIEMVNALKEKGITPRLLIATVGYDPASEVYVGKKIEIGKRLGINVVHYKSDDNMNNVALQTKIEMWNNDPAIHGIIVQLPVPDHISEPMIRSTIDPRKDVDGLTYENAGRLDDDNQYHTPCTPAGIMEIFSQNGIKLAGKKVVIFGRSNIVGKPMQKLLLNANASVTVLHSKIDRDQQMEISRDADIVIVAIGKPWFLQPEFVKDGAVIVDVGINRVESYNNKTSQIVKSLVGDVDVDSIKKYVSDFCITPVPGGVGPMTVQMLMRNVVNAALEKEMY